MNGKSIEKLCKASTPVPYDYLQKRKFRQILNSVYKFAGTFIFQTSGDD